MPTLRTQRGITLVEACTVIAILAITASGAGPGFHDFIEKQRLDGTAAQLAADIQFARSEAVLRNAPLRMSFHDYAEGTCYVVHSGGADDCVCQAAGPANCNADAQPLKTVLLPASDRVAVQANVASILFDPLHGTSTPAGTLRVVASSGRAIHHVVNVMGRVRTCSPALMAPTVPGYRAC